MRHTQPVNIGKHLQNFVMLTWYAYNLGKHNIQLKKGVGNLQAQHY